MLNFQKPASLRILAALYLTMPARLFIPIVVFIGASVSCIAQSKTTPPDSLETVAGRYTLQIFKEDDDFILYRLDTFTGRVWVYNPTVMLSFSEQELKELSPEAKAFYDKNVAAGNYVHVPFHWVLIPEKPDGVSVKYK